MTDPAGAVESELIARLADDETGLNANFAALIQPGGPYVGLDALSFDFTEDSRNFNLGRIAAAELIESSHSVFPNEPYLMAEVLSGVNNGRVVNASWLGDVTAQIECLFSWDSEEPTDFSTLPNALIAAMVQTLNLPSNQSWDGGVIYNAGMSFQKSQTTFGGGNWLRSVLFAVVFKFVGDAY